MFTTGGAAMTPHLAHKHSHGDLLNVQGGSSGEQYHLTAKEHELLTSMAGGEFLVIDGGDAVACKERE